MTSDLGPRTSDAASAVAVTVEAVAWVTTFVGGDGSKRRAFPASYPAGTTVRGALEALAGQFPKLREALWDASGQNLAEHIEVLVNDAVLGVQHTLDSPLREGDRITLIGAFTGG
ncbi:MAG: MoaD/ThiS family protein [Candidatus Methylomirabilales bacterium]